MIVSIWPAIAENPVAAFVLFATFLLTCLLIRRD